MANQRKAAGKDRTLDDELEPEPTGKEVAPAANQREPDDGAPSREFGDLLEGSGMAGIDYTRRRYGMAGAGFVSTAAATAEEARGAGGGDLIVLSIPDGELGRVMDVLESLGARRVERV